MALLAHQLFISDNRHLSPTLLALAVPLTISPPRGRRFQPSLSLQAKPHGQLPPSLTATSEAITKYTLAVLPLWDRRLALPNLAIPPPKAKGHLRVASSHRSHLATRANTYANPTTIVRFFSSSHRIHGGGALARPNPAHITPSALLVAGGGGDSLLNRTHTHTHTRPGPPRKTTASRVP